jgi:transposase
VGDASAASPGTQARSAEARVVELEAQLAALTVERDTLRLAYRNAQQELELLRRRLFLAKAERLDTAQLELELGHKLAALDALSLQLGTASPQDAPSAGASPASPRSPGTKRKPTGRRDLSELALPEDRIELTDPVLEGRAERIDWDVSYQLSWRRAGFVRVAIARAKYRVVEATPDAPAESTLATTPVPPQLLTRSLATSSLLAHVLSEKFCDGLPFHRQEDRFTRLGLRLDRGTMCRWAEEIGATLGATVVEAMREEAMRTAFCISTDATGVLVQPIQGGDQSRRGCRRGHFLVQIADADHIFFEYLAKETSVAIGELFRGFSGYIQADAKSVYDLLFKPPAERPPPDDGVPDLAERQEVGCWSHYPEFVFIWCRTAEWPTAGSSHRRSARRLQITSAVTTTPRTRSASATRAIDPTCDRDRRASRTRRGRRVSSEGWSRGID